jgi:hypothetical protein
MLTRRTSTSALSISARRPASIPLPQSYLPMGASYFSSERSFAQLRLPDTGRALVGFGREATTLLVVCASGSFFRARFDADRGGACEQLAAVQFLEG